MQIDLLIGALELFCDPGFPNAQFPSDEDDARTKWGAAFFAYVADIKASSGPPPLTDKVAKAFHDTLSLTPTIGAIPAAHDLAAAWKAAMASMFAFDDLDAREGTLRGDLGNLFSAPTLDAKQRIKQIAEKFDKASSPITSGNHAITYT